MMRTNRTRLLTCRAALTAGVLLAASGISYSADAPAEEWKAPARAAKKENPIASDAASIAEGNKAYAGNCLACHGAAGKGDGPASKDLKVKPKDLAEDVVVKQSDGALFWKLTEGRPPMPATDKTLTETERWQIINYVRTFAKK